MQNRKDVLYKDNRKKYFQKHNKLLHQNTDDNLLQIVKRLKDRTEAFDAEMKKVRKAKADARREERHKKEKERRKR